MTQAVLGMSGRSLDFSDSDIGVKLPNLLPVGYRLEVTAFVPFTSAQFAGEDPVVALEAALQFEDTRESMHAFCVGQYLEVRLCTGALGIVGLPPEDGALGLLQGGRGRGSVQDNMKLL